MLFPENPEKRPELWKSAMEQLTHEEMCYLVLEGAGYPDASGTVDSKLAEKVIQRMRQSNISRISASRGKAISPRISRQTYRMQQQRLPSSCRIRLKA